MAIIYLRRLKKAGYFGENKEEKKNFGTTQDFTKLFGNSVGPDNG